MYTQRALLGMTLIDVVVGTALVLIVFLGLFGLLRASIDVSQLTKAKAVATAVGESQMEYVRSLSYDNVGTIAGIPAGIIPQQATTTENGVAYGVRTFIDYADDPADGLGAADSNGIITDYKRIKVTVSYVAGGQTRYVTLVSNYSPVGLETTTGGGTLKIVVVDATGTAVPGASVRIVNSVIAPSVDLTTFSDATGIVYLPGAATSSEYQVYVSKNGYSSAQTYAHDAVNASPTPGYLTVAKDQTTTSTFAIDRLATLTMHTYSPVAQQLFADTFATAANLASQNNTQVTGSALTLSSDVTGYAASGNAVSTPVAPTYLVSWASASSTMTTSGDTAAVFHIVDSTGALLPDAVLAGNSAGFTGTVDLSGVSATTYPTLALRADLSTSDPAKAPLIQRWGLSYLRGPIPLPNVSFTLTGAKTIGSTGGGSPIYKTTISTSTGATSSKALSLEWDSYALAVPSYDAADICNAPPYALTPGSASDSSLYLTAPTTNSLLVSVRDAGGTAVPGASVTLSRTGYSNTVLTSACGGAYFGGITASNTYTITVSKTGYTTDTNTNVNIAGQTFYADTL